MAAFTASRKSTLYVSDRARILSVMRSASSPFSPVVTCVTWSCLANSALYDAHASADFVTTAIPAPTAPVSRAVFDVSSSVRLPVTPSFEPNVSSTLPNSPNFPPPPFSSLVTSARSFLASFSRVFSWSRLAARLRPNSPFFSSSVMFLYITFALTKASDNSLILPRAV